MLETAEEKAAKEARTRQLVAAYKSKMGMNIDPKLRSECEKVCFYSNFSLSVCMPKYFLPLKTLFPCFLLSFLNLLYSFVCFIEVEFQIISLQNMFPSLFAINRNSLLGLFISELIVFFIFI